MMYYNTIYHYGIEEVILLKVIRMWELMDLLVPDLPFEEQKEAYRRY